MEMISFKSCRMLMLSPMLTLVAALAFGADAPQLGPLADRSRQGAFSVPPSSGDPAAAPLRYSQFWPQGYYPGDPIPLRTLFLNSCDKDNPFHADVLKRMVDEGHAIGTLEDYCRWRRGTEVFERFMPSFELSGASSAPPPDSSGSSKAK